MKWEKAVHYIINVKAILFFAFLIINSTVSGKIYYVAVNGNDSYTVAQAQNINTPWATWQKAINSMASGDTIFIRGGVYYLSGRDPWVTIDPTIGRGKSGTKAARSCLWAYPPDYASGNFPILDCKNATTAYETNYSAVGLNATQYWHIKGLTVRNAFQRGVSAVRPQGFGGTNSANITFENCTAHDITARGFYFESGAWNTWDGSGALFTSDTTRWINCDAYNICDSISLSSGDAWKCGNYVGGVFYFTGCRAWNYGDDGIDPSGAGKKIFENCWVTSTNKYINLGGIEGNGIKTAGFGDDQTGHYDPTDHYVVVKNCIAAYCKGYGFYNNLEASAQNNALYINNTAYRCYAGFSDIFRPVTRTSEYRNNISIYSTSQQSGMDPMYEVAIYYPSTYPGSNNNWLGTNSTTDWPGWTYNPAVTVTDADFMSVNANELTTPRKSDGSLPDINFLKLAAGSDLINKGIDVGLPYFGSAPDLGYSESNSGTVTPPNPLYTNSVIGNNTPATLEMTYNLTLANVVPAASAFAVKVNSVARTINSVAISGTKVSLTLSSPVVYGNVITVSYTKPATNPLQTSAGGQAVTITAQPVTNNVAAIIPVYASSIIANATPSTLELTYNLALANVVPAASAFTVMVNSVVRTVNSVAISGTKVSLTLSSPVVYGNVITVAYTKPTTNPLQATAGGQTASITAQPVTNNVGAIIPVYASSIIANATPSTLELTYNLTLANVVPVASAFTVMVNSVARTINSVVISGTKVSLALSSPVVYGNVITVAYTKPTTNPLQATAGGQAITITAQPVTNNVAAIIPVYASSIIANATPSTLELTYNLTLANVVPAASAFTVMVNSVARTINSVAITGTKVSLTLSSPVVCGDVITVAYTKPATNPLQTTAVGQAASITAQPVTNNVAAINPVYAGSIIANATPSTLEMTYNLTLSNIVPAVSAFTVLVNSVARTINSVVISGTKVSLTLSSPVVYGNVITIAYTKPATNPLQATAGGQAVSITAQAVTNNVAATSPVYVSSVIRNTSPSILRITYSLTLASIKPASSSFIVKVNSVVRSVNSVAISGSKVLLTLSSPVVYGNVVTIAYNKPVTNPLQTVSGGKAASFSARKVTNNVYAVSQALKSSEQDSNFSSLPEMTNESFQTDSLSATSIERRMIIYPNPATNYINLSFDEPLMVDEVARIFNMSGGIVLEQKLDSGTGNVHIPINLKPGIYVLQVGTGKLILYTQKLIISN